MQIVSCQVAFYLLCYRFENVLDTNSYALDRTNMLTYRKIWRTSAGIFLATICLMIIYLFTYIHNFVDCVNIDLTFAWIQFEWHACRGIGCGIFFFKHVGILRCACFLISVFQKFDSAWVCILDVCTTVMLFSVDTVVRWFDFKNTVWLWDVWID